MKYNKDKALEILQQTPITLKSFLENLSDEWIYCNEGENTWSAFDIIGHLIHGEITDWIPRMDIILSNSSNKTFQPFDRFAQFKISEGKSIEQLLTEFSTLRNDNLKKLKSIAISEEQLKTRGIHPQLGEITLKELLSCWVVHDLGHITQITRVMAKQYKNEVGPWDKYLPILHK